MPEGVPHFAERLDALFQRVPKPGTTDSYSNAAVADELSATGVPVTAMYLSQLRRGVKDNPSAKLVGGLAAFFGVPVAYFFDQEEASRIQAQLDQLAILRDQRIRGIMHRTQGMSEAGVEHLAGIIDHIRSIEGLDRDQEKDPGPPEAESPGG